MTARWRSSKGFSLGVGGDGGWGQGKKIQKKGTKLIGIFKKKCGNLARTDWLEKNKKKMQICGFHAKRIPPPSLLVCSFVQKKPQNSNLTVYKILYTFFFISLFFFLSIK